MKTSLEIKHLGNGDKFAVIASLVFCIVGKACYESTGWGAVEVSDRKERFAVMCSRCR